MVVGAPNIDHEVEATLEFVDVVSDIGGKVGVLAVFPLHHAVLLVTERRAAEPRSPVLHVQVPGLPQSLECALHLSAVIQRLLREPMIESDAELEQIVTAIAQLLGKHEVVDVRVIFAQQLLGVGDQAIEMCFRVCIDGRNTVQQSIRRVNVAAPMRPRYGLGHVAHVLALVAIRRK